MQRRSSCIVKERGEEGGTRKRSRAIHPNRNRTPAPPNRLLDLLVDDIGSVLATETEEADGEKEERTEDSKQKHSSHKPLKHSSHKAFAEALESQPKIPQKPIMTSQGEISPSPKEQPLSRPHPLARRVSYGGTRNVLIAHSGSES